MQLGEDATALTLRPIFQRSILLNPAEEGAWATREGITTRIRALGGLPDYPLSEKS